MRVRVNSKLDSHDTAVFLQWAGLSMLVIYGVTVFTDIFPLALLRPLWLVRFSGKVLGGGAFALTGAVLMVFSLHFDGKVLPLSRFQNPLRKLARLVALGFLLLIPLQAIAGVMVWTSESRDVQQKLNQLQQASVVISKAKDEPALIKGLSLLPGAPRINGQKLAVPVPVVKTQVLAQLNRQIPLLETRSLEIKKLQLESGVALWFKQGVVSGAYAVAFWMLGGIRDQSRVDRGDHPMALAPRPEPSFQRLRPRRVDDMTIPAEWLEGPESMEQSGS